MATLTDRQPLEAADAPLEAHPGHDRPTEGRRRPAPVFVVLAGVFFLLPTLMWVGGARARPFENHPLAAFPSPRASWVVLDEANQWFIDAMPGRQDAVRWRAGFSNFAFGQAPPSGSTTDAAASVGAGSPGSSGSKPSASASFGEAPARSATSKRQQDFVRLPPVPPEPAVEGSSTVLVGQDGWLYLTGEFYKECYPETPPAEVIQGLQRLQAILAATGRRLVLTLAPDKSTAEPAYLPDPWPDEACASQAKKQTYQLLSDAGLTGYVDSLALIEQHQTAERRDYYLRKDTHWNGVAAATVAQALVARLSPGLLADTRQHDWIGTYTGDLTTLLGTPTPDQGLDASIERTGVVVTTDPDPVAGVQSAETTAQSTVAPLAPGRTLLVGDSFAESLIPQLAPFFHDLVWIHDGDVREVPLTVAQDIQSSRSVIVVWNERYFADPAYGTLWSTPFLDKLQQVLTPIGPATAATGTAKA